MLQPPLLTLAPTISPPIRSDSTDPIRLSIQLAASSAAASTATAAQLVALELELSRAESTLKRLKSERLKLETAAAFAAALLARRGGSGGGGGSAANSNLFEALALRTGDDDDEEGLSVARRRWRRAIRGVIAQRRREAEEERRRGEVARDHADDLDAATRATAEEQQEGAPSLFIECGGGGGGGGGSVGSDGGSYLLSSPAYSVATDATAPLSPASSIEFDDGDDDRDGSGSSRFSGGRRSPITTKTVTNTKANTKMKKVEDRTAVPAAVASRREMMLQGEVVESLAFEVQREKILAAHDSGSAAKKSWGRGARWAVKHQPQLLKDTTGAGGAGVGVGARARAGVAVKQLFPPVSSGAVEVAAG